MAKVKPFRGIRPPAELVEDMECRPYDVLSSEEAREEAGTNEKSLYHIIKPEINFPPGMNEYDSRVYESGVEQFNKFLNEGWLVQDHEENYYLYAQTMNGKTQYGIVLCVHIDDYVNGVIKRHELTRKDKEEDRMKHIRNIQANIEPVFLAYRENQSLSNLISKYVNRPAEYDFVAPVDGFSHRFWVIADKEDQAVITHEFSKMDSLYIADGHHRSAAAALVGLEAAAKNPSNTGREEYNYFMAACFSSDQLSILDYNRVVKDLNGMSVKEFLKALQQNFILKEMGTSLYKPQNLHEFSLYICGRWYSLTARPGTYDESDPIASLDVDISSRLILNDLLGIQDLRTDQRIDFVGGLRGLDELKTRVDSGEMKLALALYPVSMKQIMQIADAGKMMPPKATWFEPKLRSGLVIHKLY